MTKTFPSKIKELTEKIVKDYKPEKIILFGSYAWGKPHTDSDVDLFIVKESRKRQIDRMRELRMKLIGNNFLPMDLLIYTPKELDRRLAIGDFFVREIMEKGQVLYEQ
ncbi:MAG: nucleotidyltransferase domain-containing protein [Patescibacteria group bacterium]